MNIFEGDEMGGNSLLPLITIIPALVGSGLISAGFIIHPLFTLKKENNQSLELSIWQITEGNRQTLTLILDYSYFISIR